MPEGFIWQPSPEFQQSTNVYRFIERLGTGACQEFIACEFQSDSVILAQGRPR